MNGNLHILPESTTGSPEQSERVTYQEDEVLAAKAPLELEQSAQNSKGRLFSKRKLLIIASSLVVLIVLGALGTKFYLDYQEKQKALAESNAAFNSAQSEFNSTSYHDAEANLEKVIPIDPHYAQAQKQIALLDKVNNISLLVMDTNADMTKYNNALQGFFNNYETIRVPINAAIQFYYPASSLDAQSYIGKASSLLVNVTSSEKDLEQTISSISSDLGSISSNTDLASFKNMSQILTTFQEISNQASSISSAINNQIQYLQQNNVFIASGSPYINQINTSRDSLDNDVTNAKQDIAALMGFASGKANDLLQQAQKIK